MKAPTAIPPTAVPVATSVPTNAPAPGNKPTTAPATSPPSQKLPTSSDTDVHVRLVEGATAKQTATFVGDIFEGKVTIDKLVNVASPPSDITKHKALIGYLVTIENVGKKEFYVGSWLLRTSNGFDYTADYYSTTHYEALGHFEKVAPGGKVQGFVGFTVKEDTPGEPTPTKWLRYQVHSTQQRFIYFDA
ncbi:MAG: hypothetical protein ACR2OU_01045 [Thermomicrobiales bacterium]